MEQRVARVLVIAADSGQGSVCRHVWEFSVISLVRQGSSYCHEPAVTTAESDYGPPAVKGRALYARLGARHVSRSSRFHCVRVFVSCTLGLTAPVLDEAVADRTGR